MTKRELERNIQWKLTHEQYVHFLLTGLLPDDSTLEDYDLVDYQQRLATGRN